MNTSLIFSKTAKGLTELKNGARNLSRPQAQALGLIDGKSSVESLTFMLDDLLAQKLILALEELVSLDLIHVFLENQYDIDESLASTVQPMDKHRSSSIPAIDVVELSPEASVQAWAEAQRAARSLEETGFYSPQIPLHRFSNRSGKTGIRVLVVEDDEVTSQMLEFLLRENGFYVKTAANGTAAFAELDKRPIPDLVLLDVMLPDKNGFDILKQIRSSAGLSELPVIMVTAKISDENVLRGLKEGADGYIFKPFQWESLHNCIKSVCGI